MDLPKINTDKLIIISDTHIGSIYENISYLETVYNYATKNNIHHIIHTGDLIQSTYRNHNKKYYNEESQINHLLSIYPYQQDITNHILFGNHDYNTFHKDSYYYSMLSTRLDFQYLGTKTSYILWNNEVIGLHHHCPRYQVTIPNLKALITFCGHSHHLEVRKSVIYVPTLSDDIKDNSTPGFLISYLTPGHLSITNYDLISHEKSLVLQKSI